MIEFNLSFSYNPDVVKALKTLPAGTRRWVPELRSWAVRADQIFNCATVIEPLLPHLSEELRESPRYEKYRAVLAEKKEILAKSRAVDSALEIPLPAGLEYLPYQKAGISFCSDRESVLIGDSMGLGKTIQAIGYINLQDRKLKTLIICPATLKQNWKKELQKWLVDKTYSINIVNGSGVVGEADINIINYDILKKHHSEIHSQEWDLLIADEVHYLKNPKAGRTQEVVGKWHKDSPKPAIRAKKRLFLTGTPIVNRPIELWSILNYLDPETWRSWKYYTKRYCNGHVEMVWTGRAEGYREVYKCDGASNLEEFQEKLRSTILVRRLKKDVLLDLPAKIRQIIEISLAAKIMKRLIERGEELDRNWGITASFEEGAEQLSECESLKFEELAAYRHELAVAKIEPVIEYLKDAVESSGKVVFFAHHKDMIQAVAKEFGSECVVISGDTPVTKRQGIVERFQSDDTIKLFIGNIQAAGVGITLTAASHVIFGELDWVPGNVTQAEDRCHRIGQKDSVLVQHLVIDGTLDAKMAQFIVDKQRVIDAALDIDPSLKVEERVKKVANALSDKISAKRNKRNALRKKAFKVLKIDSSEDLEEEEIMTSSKKQAILHALRIISSACDGARELDGYGFNKMDTEFGKQLASQTSLSDEQAFTGRDLVYKYRKQIGDDILLKGMFI